MEIKLTKKNYDEIVKNSNKPVLIDFWATWCGPCKMIAPIIEDIANERTDIKVCKVNVDEESELAVQFKIYAIPTIIVVKNGEITARSEGYKAKEEILKLIDW